ncbi:MAG: FAD-dependent thymidylate synthase [Candidatus Dadabacteria bacterium]|nr:FAD-dependent thymidylate synthase [Candidatus Dadabacteria bacterium]
MSTEIKIDDEDIAREMERYVSNLDRDIYTISNIPEEVVAVIFAYVSRSPKSFRENIDTVIREQEMGRDRAEKFHEKWVLNYGHASVAEHATVHIGVERVSRLFSSLLECANEFLSFTEYSQRYQRPRKGDNYIPQELDSRPALKKEFEELCDFQYEVYSRLNTELFDFLKKKFPVPEDKEERAHFRALEKIAFEDARYALNLSTLTNLGMTANARAMEQTISALLSSRYLEARNRAEEIKSEVKFSVPTLVKYADENPYMVRTREALEEFSHSLGGAGKSAPGNGSSVTLFDYTGRGTENPQAEALREIARGLLFEFSGLSVGDIERHLSESTPELRKIFLMAVQELGKHDNPVGIFKSINYNAEFVLSEAAWHQLLRHRKVSWIIKEPSVGEGVTVPPHVTESGTEELLLEAVGRSERFYGELVDAGFRDVASYVVTNAHNRRVCGSFDLWELYHLTNLRMSEGAQWDIKNVIEQLAQEIDRVHPVFVRSALKRVS